MHGRTRLRALKLLIVALGIVIASCRSTTPETARAVCAVALPPHLREVAPDALPFHVWHALLLKPLAGGAPVDCSGRPVHAPSGSCAARDPVRPADRRLRPRAESLIVRHAGGSYWLGWMPLVALADGLAEGPVAIARSTGGRLEARALGTLRAYPARTRLSIRRLGKRHVLVAEGEHCAAGSACVRATRLMRLERQRFWGLPLRGAMHGRCLGPAWFPHSERVVTTRGRWQRTLQRDLALAYADDEVVVDEHITAIDRDLTQPSAPPRRFRDAHTALRLRLGGRALLVTGESLWPAIQRQHGATDLGAAPTGIARAAAGLGGGP